MPTQTLFDDQEPKPFNEYPPRDAHIVALILGCIPLLGLIVAPLMARKWPSDGWKWGLYSSIGAALCYATLNVSQGGLLLGLIKTFTSPSLLVYIFLCCVLAYGFAKNQAQKP
jgi:hypothetical protein